MKITKKRINNVKNYLIDINDNTSFVLGVTVNKNVNEKILRNLEGDREVGFVPRPEVGIQSQRNTVGEFIPDKTKEKEIAYRDLYWELTDFGGHIHSGYNAVPYKRYPRSFRKPKGLSLNYAKNDNIFIIEKKFIKGNDNFEEIKFGVNLLLEIFGSAETFLIDGNELKTPTKEEIMKVNWEIFPKGDHVWDYVQKHERTYGLSKSSNILIKERFNFIESFKPSFKCVGKAGFTGYVVFYFKNEEIYIFDSIKYGNATYIFDGDWESLSKMTKQQIISGHYEKKRLVHNDQWKDNIKKELQK